MEWQVQQAKQRFSEVLRAAETDGPQIVTRHGEEIAVVMNINRYRELTGTGDSFLDAIMGLAGDYGDEFAEVMDEVVRERKNRRSREIDFFGEDA
jgi:prevent-host-death family protein